MGTVQHGKCRHVHSLGTEFLVNAQPGQVVVLKRLPGSNRDRFVMSWTLPWICNRFLPSARSGRDDQRCFRRRCGVQHGGCARATCRLNIPAGTNGAWAGAIQLACRNRKPVVENLRWDRCPGDFIHAPRLTPTGCRRGAGFRSPVDLVQCEIAPSCSELFGARPCPNALMFWAISIARRMKVWRA